MAFYEGPTVCNDSRIGYCLLLKCPIKTCSIGMFIRFLIYRNICVYWNFPRMLPTRCSWSLLYLVVKGGAHKKSYQLVLFKQWQHMGKKKSKIWYNFVNIILNYLSQHPILLLRLLQACKPVTALMQHDMTKVHCQNMKLAIWSKFVKRMMKLIHWNIEWGSKELKKSFEVHYLFW